MKDLIVKKEKVTRICQQLRVPLLIYTGKILQDYQNGLGVFVSTDEMRFVSNGDAIVNDVNSFRLTLGKRA